MAELLGLIGFPSFVVVSLLLGVRLLTLAARTRKLPELAIGLNFLVAGALGYSLLIAAESLRLFPERLAGYGSFAGVVGISTGGVLIALFSRQVFRPQSRIAGALLAAYAVWTALGIYGSWVLHVSHAEEPVGFWLGRWGPNFALLAGYGWSTFESLRYHGVLRRRVRIGLGDPLVAERLLLWGVGTLALVGVALVHLLAQLAGRHQLPPSLLGASSLLILLTAVCEWLAFFPPARYRRRFARA